MNECRSRMFLFSTPNFSAAFWSLCAAELPSTEAALMTVELRLAGTRATPTHVELSGLWRWTAWWWQLRDEEEDDGTREFSSKDDPNWSRAEKQLGWVLSEPRVHLFYGEDAEFESLYTSSWVMELWALKGKIWRQWSLQQLHLSSLERERERQRVSESSELLTGHGKRDMEGRALWASSFCSTWRRGRVPLQNLIR